MDRRFMRSFLIWIGHLIGFVSSAFFMAFLIGEGLPDFFKPGFPREARWFIVMLLLTVVGYLTSIFKRATGSLLMIGGGFLMSLFHLIMSASATMAFVYGAPFILAGAALYLADAMFGAETSSN